MTNCPICNSKLAKCKSPETNIMYDDLECRQDDHFFIVRLKGDEMIKCKVRLGSDSNNDKLFLRIEYDKGTTEVWSKTFANKVTISETMVPDFSNIDKLRNKIKTYLLFS